MSELIQDDGTYAAMPPPIPEQLVINGVTYVRQAGWVDEQVNELESYQAIADRAGISLRQAIWFHQRGDGVMPD